MNEQKKSHNDYFNPNITKQQENAEQVLALLTAFINRVHVDCHDYIVLNKMIKQLKTQRKNGVPSKILHSIQDKFIIIQNRYCNQKTKD